MVKLKRLPDFTWKIPNPEGTWIISPDKHCAPDDDPNGGVDRKAMNCLYQASQMLKPDGHIDLGDIGEWTSVSPWKYKRRKRPDVSRTVELVKKDVEAVNAELDMMDDAFRSASKKILIQGNHEIWLDSMIEEWKDLLGDVVRKDLSIPEMLKLKKRGIAYVPYGDYVRLGQLFLYHGGHYGGEYHAASHLRGLSASVMYGHYHDYQVAKRGLLGKGLHAAWSIGTLCEARKPFVRGRPVNWSHNFAIVHVEKDGSFHVEVVEIFDGTCYVQGRKIVG